MAKVRDVMTKDIPSVDANDSVLVASEIMNREKWTGVVVTQSGKPVGMLTDRAILRRFVKLNKKPNDVRVREVMAPLLKVKAEASTKEALRTMLSFGFSRLGVFDKGDLVGWITLTDVAREGSKQGLVDMILRRNDSDADDEVLCPRCRNAVLSKVTNKDGRILRWECPKCNFLS